MITEEQMEQMEQKDNQIEDSIFDKTKEVLHKRYVSGGEISEQDFTEVDELLKEEEGIRIINLAADDSKDPLPDTTYSLLVLYKPPKKFKGYKKGIGVLHGVFTFRIPTIGDNISLGRLKAKYRGGVPPESMSTEDDLRTDALARLHILLESKPDWFDLDHLYDEDLVFMLWERQIEKENFFRTGSSR